jgi:hypothetical protein
MITKINDFKLFENNNKEILLTEENKVLKEFKSFGFFFKTFLISIISQSGIVVCVKSSGDCSTSINEFLAIFFVGFISKSIILFLL